VYHIPRNQLNFLASDLKLIRGSVDEIAERIPVSGKDQAYRQAAIAAMGSLEDLINEMRVSN
jgi:hypothetical protein